MLFAWALAPLSATAAQIYRWVDSNGTPHFTDRPEEVPPAFRDQLAGNEASADGPFAGMGVFDGLDILPGEADGTTVGQTPAGGGNPQEMAEHAQTWLKAAGAGVVAVVIVFGLVMVGLFVALLALLLLLGCRVVGQERPGFKKAYGIVLVQMLAGALVAPGVVLVAGPGQATDVGGVATYQLASFGLGLLVNALVLRGMLTRSFLRALGIAVVTMLINFGVGLALGAGVLILAFAVAA